MGSNIGILLIEMRPLYLLSQIEISGVYSIQYFELRLLLIVSLLHTYCVLDTMLSISWIVSFNPQNHPMRYVLWLSFLTDEETKT